MESESESASEFVSARIRLFHLPDLRGVYVDIVLVCVAMLVDPMNYNTQTLKEWKSDLMNNAIDDYVTKLGINDKLGSRLHG